MTMDVINTTLGNVVMAGKVRVQNKGGLVTSACDWSKIIQSPTPKMSGWNHKEYFINISVNYLQKKLEKICTESSVQTSSNQVLKFFKIIELRTEPTAQDPWTELQFNWN